MLNKNEATAAATAALLNTERNFILKSGESTVDLEREKNRSAASQQLADSALEALKAIGQTK